MKLKESKEQTETKSPFEGMVFKNPPVTYGEYCNAYKDYVKRCSINTHYMEIISKKGR